jgi:hypothetical protein
LGRSADRALRLKPYLAIVWNRSQCTVALSGFRSHVKFPDAVCGPALGRGAQQGIPVGGKMVISIARNVERESLESGGGAWLDQFVQEKEWVLANATALRIGFDAVIFDDDLLSVKSVPPSAWAQRTDFDRVTAARSLSRKLLLGPSLIRDSTESSSPRVTSGRNDTCATRTQRSVLACRCTAAVSAMDAHAVPAVEMN